MPNSTESGDRLFEIGLLAADVRQSLVEEFLVDPVVGDLLVKLRQQFGGVVAGNLLLVQSLQQKFTSTRARPG